MSADRAGLQADATLVSVIVPAYNAGQTLDETLISIRSQTHVHLDIIVVDDGSTDDTLAIAQRHASQDGRIRVVSQANAGVAAARNHGIELARAGLIAPIDADDVWSPSKIALQVATFVALGDDVALVYTLHAIIDEKGEITGYGHCPAETEVDMRAMCRRNVVGNGSAAMMRRADVIAVGGYDPALRERQAQGCEDYKLYLALAERGRIVAVPEFLTGYRCTPANMSSDVLQMERSHDIVYGELLARHPELAVDIDFGRTRTRRWLIGRSVRSLKWRPAWSLFRRMLRRDLAAAAAIAVGLTVRAVRKIGRKARPGRRLRQRAIQPGRRFPNGSPEHPEHVPES